VTMFASCSLCSLLCCGTVGFVLLLAAVLYKMWPSSQPKLYRLPKANVWGFGEDDTRLVYHEMFEMSTRLTNSVSLRPGDVVIDGGANIGLFSMSLLMDKKTPAGVKIHAFEPVPATFAAATLNLKSLAQVTLHNVGLSDETKSVEFHWSPVVTCNAGPESHIREMFRSVGPMSVKALQNIAETNRTAHLWPEPVADVMCWAFGVPVLKYVPALLTLVFTMLSLVVRILTTKKIPAKLITVGDMFKLTGATNVGLMKLDVEGAELEVLSGMKDDDWARIDQLWIEVHDIRGRLKTIQDMLRSHGYKVTVSQDDLPLLDTLHIYAVFATRR